jgi:hypothetical protein
MRDDVDEGDLILRYLRGEAELEPVARALAATDAGYFFVRNAEGPLTVEEQAQQDRLRTLFARVHVIYEATRLIDVDATPQDMDAWDPPADPENFCLSVSVMLSGRDMEREYRRSMRAYVCTPAWLAARSSNNSYWMNPTPLVVPIWRPHNIRDGIKRLVYSGGDNTWEQFVERMSRYMDFD